MPPASRQPSPDALISRPPAEPPIQQPGLPDDAAPETGPPPGGWGSHQEMPLAKKSQGGRKQVVQRAIICKHNEKDKDILGFA